MSVRADMLELIEALGSAWITQKELDQMKRGSSLPHKVKSRKALDSWPLEDLVRWLDRAGYTTDRRGKRRSKHTSQETTADRVWIAMQRRKR